MTPKCDNHQPVAEYETDERGTMVVIHCYECGFTAFMHPQSYAQFLANTGMGSRMVH